jgi:hypothetical protein
VIHAEERGELHLSVDLLAAFTNRRRGRVLVVVDETSGQAPLSVRRLDGSAAEDDATVHLDDHRGRDFGVAPEDVAVLGADLVLPSLDELDGKGRAAVDAEVAHDNRA